MGLRLNNSKPIPASALPSVVGRAHLVHRVGRRTKSVRRCAVSRFPDTCAACRVQVARFRAGDGFKLEVGRAGGGQGANSPPVSGRFSPRRRTRTRPSARLCSSRLRDT